VIVSDATMPARHARVQVGGTARLRASSPTCASIRAEVKKDGLHRQHPRATAKRSQGRPASCACTRTTRKTSPRRRRATSARCSAWTATRATRFTDGTINSRDDVDVRAEAGHLRRDQGERTPGAEIQMVEGAETRFHARGSDVSAAFVDPESARERSSRAWGELHLDVYIERMKREYKARGDGRPAAAGRVPRDDLQEGRVQLHATRSRPVAPASTACRVRRRGGAVRGRTSSFVDEIRGRVRSRASFISAVEKGFRSMIFKSPRLGVPVVVCGVTINDGHRRTAVDSSDTSRSRKAARGAFPATSSPRAAPKNPRADHEGSRSRARPSSRATCSSLIIAAAAAIVMWARPRKTANRRASTAEVPASPTCSALSPTPASLSAHAGQGPSSRWSSRKYGPRSPRTSPRSCC